MVINLNNEASILDYSPPARPTDKVTVQTVDGDTFRVTVGNLVAQMGLEEFNSLISASYAT